MQELGSRKGDETRRAGRSNSSKAAQGGSLKRSNKTGGQEGRKGRPKRKLQKGKGQYHHALRGMKLPSARGVEEELGEACKGKSEEVLSN